MPQLLDARDLVVNTKKRYDCFLATDLDFLLRSHGVDATLRVLDPEETGAEHCQHDNPTIGQEVLADWLADRFGIDQRALLKTSINPLL